MPIAAKNPNPNEVYVATETISLEVDGVPVAIRAGDRRRGDDPLVTANFSIFAPDGTPVPAVPKFDPPPPRKRRPSYDVLVYEHLAVLDAVVLRRPLKVARAQTDGVEQLPRGNGGRPRLRDRAADPRCVGAAARGGGPET